MAAAIPTEVPTTLTAGDTARWKISLGDYPAGSGWVLSYALVKRGSGALILIQSAASGDDHLVNVAASVTADYPAGDYQAQAYVTKDGDRFQVWSGLICIKPNFVTAEGADTRSTARKILDSIEAAILKVSQAQAAGTAGAISEWSVEGLSIKRSSPEALLAELTKQRDRYAAICANEDAKARVASGRGSGRRILIQFTNPR